MNLIDSIAINVEAFIIERDGHIYDLGQRCKLVGMKDNPEFNGEVITITAYRRDGKYGKAYYFKPDNPAVSKQLNWIYESRLKKIK